jgi:tRNA(Glu) U13 pseudouridine synthase TruD
VKVSTHTMLMAAALALAPALAAQRPVSARVPSAPTSPGATRSEIRAWIGELQQIGARLQAAQDRVMAADPALRGEQQALAQALHDAIDHADPGLKPLAARAQALQAEAERAGQAGDQARVVALMREADQIQRRFIAARERALSNPALTRRIEAYEARLRTRLATQEPQLDALLSRSTDLQLRLSRVAQLQQRMAPAQRRPD